MTIEVGSVTVALRCLPVISVTRADLKTDCQSELHKVYNVWHEWAPSMASSCLQGLVWMYCLGHAAVKIMQIDDTGTHETVASGVTEFKAVCGYRRKGCLREQISSIYNQQVSRKSDGISVVLLRLLKYWCLVTVKISFFNNCLSTVDWTVSNEMIRTLGVVQKCFYFRRMLRILCSEKLLRRCRCY